MSRNESHSAAPRLALVGASSLLGKEIKEQLAASGFPSTDTTLFDLEDLAGVLTDYGDEARVVVQAVADNVLAHDLVCFCGQADTAREYLSKVLAAGRVGLDCTGAWLDNDDVFPWIPGVTAPPSVSDHRAVAIPTASSLLLGSALAAIGDAAGASATVFVPASERGDAGLHELSQQSTAVLNLLDIESGVFGRQMAFDIWVQPNGDSLGAEHLVATLERLELRAPATTVIATPVFHGMALSIFIPDAGAEALAAALVNAGFRVADPTAVDVDSPLGVVGIAGIHAIQVREDAMGSWVWAVADNLLSRATAAVAAIHTLAGRPVTDAPQ